MSEEEKDIFGKFKGSDNVERALLKICCTNRTQQRQYLNRIKREWFSSKHRVWIFDNAMRVFKEEQGIFTQKIFDFELENQIADGERIGYESEWNLIKKSVTAEGGDSLIAILEKNELKKELFKVVSDAWEKAEGGDVVEALNLVKSRTVGMGIKKNNKETRNFTQIDFREKHMQEMIENPEKFAGLKTGFREFDRQTGGIFKSEYTLFAAVTGVGKSTIMKALEVGLITHNADCNVLHITNEENELQVHQKIDALTCGIPFYNFKRAKLTEEQKEHWKKTTEMMQDKTKFGQIYIRELPAYHTTADIEQVYFELKEQGIDIDVIVVDYLNHVNPIQKAYDLNDERIKASTDLKELAKSLHVAVISAAQAATCVAEKQDKGQSAGRLDIYGAKGQLFPVNSFFIITLGRQLDEDWEAKNRYKLSKAQWVEGEDEEGEKKSYAERQDWEFDVAWTIACRKNRDGAPFEFNAVHRVKIGRIEEIDRNEIPLPRSIEEGLDLLIPTDYEPQPLVKEESKEEHIYEGDNENGEKTVGVNKVESIDGSDDKEHFGSAHSSKLDSILDSFDEEKEDIEEKKPRRISSKLLDKINKVEV